MFIVARVNNLLSITIIVNNLDYDNKEMDFNATTAQRTLQTLWA